MGSRRRSTISLVAFCTIIAALGAATHSYRADIQEARHRVSHGSLIAQTTCGPLEYAVAGNGPPVLVVHGAGGGFDQGLEFGTPLIQKGFRIIAMSRFGYLRTPLPENASAEAQADAHACLLDALGIERVAVVGAPPVRRLLCSLPSDIHEGSRRSSCWSRLCTCHDPATHRRCRRLLACSSSWKLR